MKHFGNIQHAYINASAAPSTPSLFQTTTRRGSDANPSAVTVVSSDDSSSESSAQLPRLRPRKSTTRYSSSSSISTSDSASSDSASSDSDARLLMHLASAAPPTSKKVVQHSKLNPIPPSASVTSTSKSKSDKVVQLDAGWTNEISADSWDAAKSRLIGLMKNTGHSRAFIRTSKKPPTIANYWAKCVCPECHGFIIGSGPLSALSVNKKNHSFCTGMQQAPPLPVPAATLTTAMQQAPPIPVPAATLTTATTPKPAAKHCENCGDSDLDGSFVTPCSGKHSFCSACFDTIVLNQITGANLAMCVTRNCKIQCSWCFASSNFNMRMCAGVLKETTYALYLNVIISMFLCLFLCTSLCVCDINFVCRCWQKLKLLQNKRFGKEDLSSKKKTIMTC